MKYLVQILLFVAIINNSFNSFWDGNKELVVSWMGFEGYPKYYHYWYLFHHKFQFFLYLSLSVYFLLYKLDESHRRYALGSILLYIGLSFVETINYLLYSYHQTEMQKNVEVSFLIGGFLVGNIILGIYNKAWK